MRDARAQIESHLRLWADAQRRWSPASMLGYPPASAGFSSGGVVSADAWEDLEDEVDSHTVAAVDAIIDSLQPIHRAAIMHQYLAAVFRARRSLDEVLEEATVEIERQGRAKGLC